MPERLSLVEPVAIHDDPYACQTCGQQFQFMSTRILHEIEKHNDVRGLPDAVDTLARTAAEFAGQAAVTLTVDGLSRQAYEQIDATERYYGLGRSCKTVVLVRGRESLAIRYVLDEDAPDQVAESYRMLLPPGAALTEGAIAAAATAKLLDDQAARHSVDVRNDWPVHRPAAPEAPIPGRHWYSGCDPDQPRVNPSGVCEGCGGYGCPKCGREGCSGGTDCEAS